MFLHEPVCPFHSAIEYEFAVISRKLVKIAIFMEIYGDCVIISNIHFICSENYEMGLSKYKHHGNWTWGIGLKKKRHLVTR